MNTISRPSQPKVHVLSSMRLSRLRQQRLAISLALALGSLLFCGSALAGSGGVAPTTTPTGGVVVGGVGSIAQSGAHTVVSQQSALLALNWQSFNLGRDATVLFKQPSFNAIALNRIFDQNPSQIFGHINSNGQVFLINTHGIIFGSSAQLNVGGLMASTLDLTPDDFLSDHFNLNAHGGRAGIVNHGTIEAASGGSVSLIGGHVENDGLIVANLGHINLDGADKAVLDFGGDGLINVQVTGALQKRLNADEAAVANKGTLQADGGTVVLQASAAKNLFTNLVNNTGVIDAHGISTAGGVVRLVGTGGNVVSSGRIDASGVHGGSVQLLSDQDVDVDGSVDASGTRGGGSIRMGGGARGGEGLMQTENTTVGANAVLNVDATQSGNGGSIAVWSNQTSSIAGSFSARGGVQGGNGGVVETSGEHVHIADGTLVNTLAPTGQSGHWLIDPEDFTIAPRGGDITGATLSANLSSGDVTLNSSAGTKNPAGTGSINVDDTVNWGAHMLTLTAADNINVNAVMTASGTAGLALNPGTASGGADHMGLGSDGFYGRVDFTGTGNTLSIGGKGYTLIDSATALQDMSNSGYYALSGNINAGDIANFTPISGSIGFSGSFDGLGHTISGLTINDTSGSNVGLFGLIGTGGVVQNVGLVGDSVTGTAAGAEVGSLVGLNRGSIEDAYATGTVSGIAALHVGGLVGLNEGGIEHAYAAGAVSGAAAVNVGGLVGGNIDTIENAYATGAVSGSGASAQIGGLVGLNDGTMEYVYATGAVSGSGASARIGGLVGSNNGTMEYAYATGAVSGSGGAPIGGLVGWNDSQVSDSYWDTQTSGQSSDASGSKATGKTTSQLQGALPRGFSSSSWGVVAGSYPYLLWQFAPGVTPVAVSGTVVGAGAGTTVNARSGGNALGSTSIGANGYFYYLFDPTALVGNNVLVSDANGDTFADPYGSTLPPLAIDANTLNIQTGATTWSTVLDDLATAEGHGATNTTALTTGLPVSVANLDMTATATGGFTLDQALIWNGSGNLVLTANGGTLATAGALSGGNITLSGQSGITLGGGVTTATAGTLTLTSADGAILQSAGILTAGTLTGSSTGSTTLGDENLIGTLGSFSAEGFSLTNAQALTVDDSLDLGKATLATNAGALTINTLNAASAFLTGAAGITLDGNVSTTGNQTYTGAVTLGGDATLASIGSGAIDFGSTVDGAHALTVNTAGLTTFAGAVGGTAALTRLATDAGGTTTLDGNVSTTGNQTYTGAVTLGNDVTLNTTDSAVDFASTVDNATSGTPEALTVNAGSGAVTFGGTVGGNATTDALGGLTVTSGTFSAGSLNIGAGGLSITTSNGAIEQNAVWKVTGTSSFDAGMNAITLTNANNAFTDAVSLKTSGNVSLTNNRATVLGTSTVGGTLAVESNGALTEADALTAAGAATFTQNNTTTGGTQDIDLGTQANDFKAGVTFAAGSGAAINNLSLENTDVTPGTLTLPANVAGNLTMNYTNAALTVPVVGVGGALDVTAGGGITINGNVTTGGGQTYNDAVTLGADATLASIGSGAIDFGSTVNGAHALTVNTAGLTTFAGAVGGTTALTSLNIQNPTGSTTLDGSVSTSGTQTYSGAVLLDSSTGSLTLTGGGVAFGGTVDNAASETLVVDAGSGGATFGGAVGGSGDALGGLTVTSGGDITQSGAFHVAGASSFNAGGHAITLNNTSNDFAGAVTASGTGVSINDGGNLTIASLTDGTNGAVSLVAGGNLVLPMGAIDTGTSDLTLSAGSTLTTVGELSGANVYLTGGTGLILQNGVATTGTLGLHSGGAITEGTNGTITAGTLAGSSTGSTTLDGANAIANLGNFTADGFSLSNAQALTVSGTVAGGTGATTLTTTGAGSDLTLAATGSVAGTGVTLTSGGTLDAAAGSAVDSDDGALGLSGGAFTLDGALNAGTGTVTLTSSGAVTQAAATGVITAGMLTGHATGSTSLLGANQVGTLGSFTANGFNLMDAQALTVAAGAAVDGGTAGTTLTTTGAGNGLTIAGTLGNTGGVTTLKSAGTIGEGTNGVVRAGMLTGSSAGSTALDGANAIANLGNFTANGFSLSNAQALTVGGAVNGGSGTTSLAATAGALSVNGSVAGDSVGLTSDGDLAINGGVDSGSGTTTLASGGAITEGTNGVVKAATLSGNASGDATLGGTNLIGTLGGFSARDISLSNGQALTVDGPLTTTGGSGNISLSTTGSGNALSVNTALSGGTITLGSAGGLTVGGNITGTAVNLGADGNLAINAAVSSGTGTTTLTQTGSGAITEGTNGTITAATLTGSSTGSTTLDGANAIANLGNFTANGFSLSNVQALTVAAGATVDGGTAGTTLTTTGAGNGLTIAGTLGNTGGVTTLNSAGAIGEGTNGVVKAGTLTGSSTGSTNLSDANLIGNLGSFNAAGLSLTDAQALTVAGPVAGGSSTTLTTTAGDLSVTGPVSGKATQLTAANDLALGGDVSGSAVALKAGGTITQSAGILMAGTLTGSSTGSTNLGDANAIDTLGSFSAAGLSLTDAQALTVAGPVAGGSSTTLTTTAGDLSVTGPVSGKATQLTAANDLALGGDVSGNTVALTANGAITQNAGILAAGTLTGGSTGSTRLTDANTIDSLGDFSAAGFDLSNAQALTVAGNVAGGTSVLLQTTQGGLSIDGALDGTLTTLRSAGAIVGGAGGDITAHTLTGSAVDATVLGSASQRMSNHVDVLGGFDSPAGFSFTNDQGLTLATVDGSAYTVNAGRSALYLGVTGGNLLEDGDAWLYDGMGTWSSTGHIGLATAPIYVTGVSNQTVADVGMPPAYFYAINAQGDFLPVVGAPGDNMPTALLSGRLLNVNGHGDAYIDASAISSNYRLFSVTPSGIRLPPDQQDCRPGQPPPPAWCPIDLASK